VRQFECVDWLEVYVRSPPVISQDIRDTIEMSFSTAEHEMFERAVRKNFADLLEWGFEISGVSSKTSAVTGEHLAVEIGLANTNRRMRVSLVRIPDEKREALMVFFYAGSTAGFELSNYLKRAGASEDSLRRLRLAAQSGDLPDRVDAVLKSARAAVDETLLNALHGGSWPDVPFDWGNYK
jgi:hypothetical protein